MDSSDHVADLQDYLAELGIVDGSSDWPSVRRHMHDGSNQLVCLSDDGGGLPELGRLSAGMESPGVQIRVRGEPNDGDVVKAKILEIKDAIHGLTGVTMRSTHYDGITAVTSAPAMFFDEQSRVNMTWSFLMTRDVPLASS